MEKGGGGEGAAVEWDRYFLMWNNCGLIEKENFLVVLFINSQKILPQGSHAVVSSASQ